MRRHSRGFLLVELIVALGIFSGVVAVMLLALQRSPETSALDMERTRAACRIDRVLQELRRGIIPVPHDDSITLPPPAEDAALPGEKCIVKVNPWDGHEALHRLTVTVHWQSRRKRQRSMSATTLVRTKRLKFARVKP